MKAEARDAMVALVQDTYAKWPKFESMPVDFKPGAGKKIETYQIPDGYGFENEWYVAALYQVCSRGKPLGRSPEGFVIVYEVPDQ